MWLPIDHPIQPVQKPKLERVAALSSSFTPIKPKHNVSSTPIKATQTPLKQLIQPASYPTQQTPGKLSQLIQTPAKVKPSEAPKPVDDLTLTPMGPPLKLHRINWNEPTSSFKYPSLFHFSRTNVLVPLP